MKKLIIYLLLSAILPTVVYSQSNMLYITANSTTMAATLVDNSSTAALKELLADAPLTIEMRDYGNFEKVGSLGHTLPRNDEDISTTAGDLILYLGSNFVIYYDHNQWDFTRLGKIDGNPTREYLLSVLGSGSVNVTLSLTKTVPSGISDVKSEMNNLNVHVSGLSVEITGVKRDAIVSVSNLNGQVIYQGKKHTIELPEAGIYIVSCNNAKAKILIN